MRLTVLGSTVIGLTGWVSSGGHAQVPEQRLTKPDAAFPQEFSTIRGLRELPDGRVMIADGMGQVLVVVDLAAGRADTIGRMGQGPEEYRQPDGLYPLPEDGTLLVDLGNGRLTELGPDFSFGQTEPLAQGVPGAGMGLSLRVPRGVDGQGHIYYQAMGGMRPGAPLPDSATVARWDRSTGRVDSVAQVKMQERQRSERGGLNNRSVEIRPVPLSPEDGWAVAPDGWVALVRSMDYRVEWIRPDGSVARGPANSYKPVKVGRAEKEAWLENQQRNALQVAISIENGRRNMMFSRGGRGQDRPNVDAYDWPDVMPPFRAGGVIVAPDGNVWVERYVAAGEPLTFDVFNRDGRLAKRVFLPTDRHMVGLGDGVVYAARYDEFDLQWLERYKL